MSSKGRRSAFIATTFVRRLPNGYRAYAFTEEDLKSQPLAVRNRLRDDLPKVLASPRNPIGDAFYYHFSAVAENPGSPYGSLLSMERWRFSS